MCRNDLRGDGVPGAGLGDGSAAEQGRLQAELGLLGLAVDPGAEDDQAVRVPEPRRQQGRPPAAHVDLVPLVLDHLEVVREPQALVVPRHPELRHAP